jgi:quercetin dioxygenase-like cupin family protein
MKLQKFRWSKVYESSEEELTDFLKARNISATRTDGEAFERLTETKRPDAITIWCAEGSFTLTINGENISMQPGDAIHILADAPYEIAAGMSGYIRYESND